MLKRANGFQHSLTWNTECDNVAYQVLTAHQVL